MELHDVSVLGSLQLPQRDPTQDVEAVPLFYVERLKYSPVFITDVTPTSTGNVGVKQYQPGTVPANAVLLSCTSDTQNVRVSFMVQGGFEGYSPTVLVENQPAQNLSQHPTAPRVFTGYHDLTLTENSVIEVQIGSGQSKRIASVDITLATAGPQVYSLVIGTLPGLQTAVKLNDLVSVSGTVDNEATEVTLLDYGAAQYTVLTMGDPDSAGVGKKTISGTFAVSNRTGSSGIRAQAKNSLNTLGQTFDSSNQVILDQTKPTFGTPSVAYPISQQALKGSEQATLTLNVSNFDTISYTSSTDLSIANPATYSPNKTIQLVGGGVSVGVNNVTITAQKNSNGSSASVSCAVNIANDAPTCTIVAGSTNTMKSSPTGIDHTVVLTPSQPLIFAPVVAAEVGAFQGSDWTFISATGKWQRNLRITDTDARGDHLFTVELTNLAGVKGYTVLSGDTYTVGGMSRRDITFPAFARFASIGTEVFNINKTNAKYKGTSDNLVLQADTSDIQGGYTIVDQSGNYDPNGGYLMISDVAFANSNTSGTLILEFEETT